MSFGVFVVPPFEAAFWAGTIVTTVVCAARSKRVPRLKALSVAVVGALALVHFTNWSVFEPRSYYLTHRWAFARVAHLADEGRLDSDEYYGGPLPRLLADLSTDGRASVLGHQDGKPIVFLPSSSAFQMTRSDTSTSTDNPMTTCGLTSMATRTC